MSYIRATISEKNQCRALHKLRARIIKNTMIRDRFNNIQDNIAVKVVKYESLLSEKMLEQIKTQELKQFQKEIRQYRESKQNENAQKYKVNQACQGISAFLNGIRQQTKLKLGEARRRSRTEQKSKDKIVINAKQSKIVRKQPSNIKIQLQNKGLNKNNESNFGKKFNKPCLNLKGKLMQSQMVNLLSRIQQMNYFSVTDDKGHLVMPIDQNYIEKDATQLLKKQSQRLNSAVENQDRVKFKPIGTRLDDEKLKLYHSEQNLIATRMPQISKKLSNASSQSDQSNQLSSKMQLKRKDNLFKHHKNKHSTILRQNKIQLVQGHSYNLEGF